MKSKNLQVVKTGFLSVEAVEALREDISSHFNNWSIELQNRPCTMQLHHRYNSVYGAYEKPSATKVSIEQDIKGLMEYLSGEDYGVDSRNCYHFTASFKVNDYRRMITYFITFTHAKTILWI